MTVEPDLAQPSRLARWWATFRRWQRVRPFWSGLLLILSGLELLLSANLDLSALEVHFGFEGFLSYLLPAIMLLSGIFVWFTPKQRAFYGIIGTLTAVYSLIGLNLGGWFLGLLLGIVGGALAFAWTPLPVAVAPTDAEPSTADSISAEDTDASEVDKSEVDISARAVSVRGPAEFDDDSWDSPAPGAVRSPSGRHREPDDDPPRRSGGAATGRWSFRFLAILLPALLAVAALTATPTPGLAAVDPCPAAAAAAPAKATTPQPTQSRPTLLDRWHQFWQKIFGGGTTAVAANPTPTPTPTATAAPAPTPTCAPPTGTPTAATTTTGSGGGGGTGSSSAPASTATPTPTPTPARTLPAAPGQPIVSDHPAHMTTSELLLEGFAFDGVVTLPTANGSIRTLQFSIDRATNQNFQLIVDGGARALAISSDPLVAAGQVKLFTTRFSGKLLGIPLTFTPDSPPPLTLPTMIFTDVSLELVFLDCQQLTGPSLLEQWINPGTSAARSSSRDQGAVHAS